MPPSLRLATPNDAEQVLAVYAPYCYTPISFELEPPDVEDVRQRMIKVLTQFPWLVCEEAGKVLGYSYAGAHNPRAAYCWSVDTSVYIHQDCHRRGIGRALYKALFQLLRLQGYINAYAGVTLPNPGSVGLHEAMGFKPVGVYTEVGYKCGKWYDVIWYELLLQPRPAQPPAPKALTAVWETDEARAAMREGLRMLRW
jgi:L-amino acid N-acyltransferase YncA